MERGSRAKGSALAGALAVALAAAACGGGPSAAADGGGVSRDAAAIDDGGMVVGADGGGLLPGDVTAPFEGGPAYWSKFSNGPPADPSFFPISVWLQSPSNASRYKAIGINTFIGLYNGPTDAQLTALAGASMPALCSQNDVGLAHLDDPTIRGWTQQDEPDNAQPDGSGGYGPCVAPSTIISLYKTMHAADPTRPVFLNLGRTVANENWPGRGSCTGQDSDYPQYVMGADIASFDYYPVNDGASIGLVAHGVDRLRAWTNYKKPVWNWIETTQIDQTTGAQPTPAQVRAEVWMSLVHGSLGIGYFCHVLNPFDETGLLDEPKMSAAVKAINAQITELAPVLNTASIANGATVKSSTSATQVDFMVKRAPGMTYLFAVAMGDAATTATFTLRDFGDATADVLGESRTVQVSGGVFTDDFDGWGVHLYRVPTP